MEIVAFLIAIAAFLVFCLVALNKPFKWNLMGVGLALLTASWVVELITTERQVHF